MKITKEQLKQIIKEEISSVLKENIAVDGLAFNILQMITKDHGHREHAWGLLQGLVSHLDQGALEEMSKFIETKGPEFFIEEGNGK